VGLGFEGSVLEPYNVDDTIKELSIFWYLPYNNVFDIVRKISKDFCQN